MKNAVLIDMRPIKTQQIILKLKFKLLNYKKFCSFTIFQKNSPMHDGAVIVQNSRIIAARCILPVTEQEDIPAQYGLRHRAGIGLTETTDAIVLIVSEETGQMSIAENGKVYFNLSSSEVRAKLNTYLYDEIGHKAEKESSEKKKDKVKK